MTYAAHERQLGGATVKRRRIEPERKLPGAVGRSEPKRWPKPVRGALLMSLLLLLSTAIVSISAPAARAATLPAGFQETVVLSGLTNPTAVRFAQDGRVFVSEKRGVIKVFDSLSDTTPTVFADLNVNVYNFWDRGLLGMALAPNFPTNPYVYVLYTYDHELGSMAPAPRWGTPGVCSDPCPPPPGATGDGCVVSGRLSRLQASGNIMTGAEQVLIEDWCQQYPSHSVGAVEFGPDGALYASGGDGASFNFVDYGQDGAPLNPCGDPPGPAGAPSTPLAASADPTARRVIAYGLRNPFRFTPRPGTRELWVGDVGWNSWEEINRIPDTADAVAENFGWPCYEGSARQSGYDGANLTSCENLYGTGQNAPHFAYNHNAN